MIYLLRRIFIDNWPRKIISLILAVIIYFVVAQSLTTTTTVPNVSIRITNIPEDKAIMNMRSNGYLDKKIDLIVTGSKKALATLTSNDIEVVVDSSEQNGEWIPKLKCKNLSPLKPNLNISKNINSIEHKSFIINLTEQVTEKVPIIITRPIGRAPKGYSFLDIWPYRLFVTVKGPKDIVEDLRKNGLKRTFNLSDISMSELNALESKKDSKDAVVSHFVHCHLKEILIPSISDTPIRIDDPHAEHLRIDFVRTTLIPIKTPVPVDLFFAPSTASQLNPSKAKLATNTDIVMKNGIKIFSKPLYAKGVSSNFLNVVTDHLEIIVLTTPVEEGKSMKWTPHIVNARQLEEDYVDRMLADAINDELSKLHPQAREEYLRNRFRSYVNRFELYTDDDKPLNLCITKKGSQILVQQQ